MSNNNNNSGSSNSLMVTLIVIVIIALGVLFFLKPFSQTEKSPVIKENTRTSTSDQEILDEDIDPAFPEETDQIPPPAQRNPNR